jgi:integrase
VSEGSVYQRADGRWCAKYKDATGMWCYLYRKSKGEAKQSLRAALKDRDEGIIPPSKMTVSALLDEWMEDTKGTVSHRTWLNREGFMRLHIKPNIGATKLAKLTVDDARRMYRRKLSEGMSTSSVKRIHELINQALSYAVRSKYINANPLNDVGAPKVTHQEMNIFTVEQVRRLLDTVRGHRWECVFVLGATLGLRSGEALALRWEDVDLAAETIQIRRTVWKYRTSAPKTPSSRRRLKLPQRALEALTRLSESSGNPSEGCWCFPTKNGNPTSPESFHTWGWKPTLRKAGLPDLRYHDLRHGAASLLINQGVPIPVVSKYLGHSNAGVTMRVYAHMIDGTGGVAARGIDEALG